MQKELLFIYNPRSGKGRVRSRLADMIDIFTKAGYRAIVYPTQGPEDVEHVLADYAQKVERVVCCGGDGTLDEVVAAARKLAPEMPIGYIPAGSTNDFAKSLHIPKNLVKAAEVAACGSPESVDLGRFNGQTFVYVAAFGIFTDVAYKTNQNLKNALGHLAYLLEAGKRIFRIPGYRVRAEIDGEEVRGTFACGMITNARSVGGLRHVTGGTVDMRDGLFEITLVDRPKNPIEFSEILTALLSSRGKSEHVHEYKASRVRLCSEEALEWTLDGEYGGTHRRVEILNLQRELQIYLPSGG